MWISQNIKNLLWNIFPHSSRGELALRSIYHTIMATKIATAWQVWKSKKSYSKWKTKQDGLSIPNSQDNQTDLKVTFILQIVDSELDSGLDTIRSVQEIQQSDWEILLFSKYSRKFLPEKVSEDKRITIVNTPAGMDSIDLYKLTSGDFILHCQAGDIFTPSLLDHFHQYYTVLPQADVFYFDCEYQSRNTSRVLPFFKPSALSPELLLSVNYLSRAFIRTSRALRLAGRGDKNLSLQNQELYLILRLVEENTTLHHIPKVLLHQSDLSAPSGKQTEDVISSHLERTGRTDTRIVHMENGTRITWKGSNPSVSIIIPSKNNPRLLRNLVESILSVTDYPNYSITIVDNASKNPELLDYYQKLEKHQNIG